MTALFTNKYRIETSRLQSWNYANEAMYFITICTKNRKHYFGEIVHEFPVETPYMASLQGMASLQCTEIGVIAYNEWFKTPELRPDMNLELGPFVVMPNHIHGIIIIGANEYNTSPVMGRDVMHHISTHNNGQNKFAPQSKNLASIIRGYKSAVTTHARKNNIEFDWQSRFHDHIIRSANEYHRISEYIIYNPVKWQEDKLYQQ